MEIKRVGSQPSSRGSADYFTGAVRLDPLFQAPDPALVTGLGLEAQSEAISRFAKAERLKIADTFAEVETLEPPTPGFGDL